MADKVETSTPTPQGEAPAGETAKSQVTLEAIALALDELKRGQRGTQKAVDSQIGNLQRQLTALQGQLGATGDTLADLAPEEERETVRQKVRSASDAAMQDVGNRTQALKLMRRELADAGLEEEDLGDLDLDDLYLLGPDKFHSVLNKAQNKKPKPAAKEDKASALEQRIAELEAKLAEAKGETSVPVGRAGANRAPIAKASDWTPELMEAFRNQRRG